VLFTSAVEEVSRFIAFRWRSGVGFGV